jgi:hypothetical protein
MSVAALKSHGLTGHTLLVEHCLALGLTRRRRPARDRLEEALGYDLTRSLVFALSRPRD